jgi:hypothetical protein
VASYLNRTKNSILWALMYDATEQFGEDKDTDHLGWDTMLLGKWF